MEGFKEYLVKKSYSGSDFAKAALVWIVAIAYFALGAKIPMYLCFSPLVILAMWYLLTGLKSEYEYIITDGSLDIDVIKAQRKRSRLASLHMANMEICASINDAAYNSRLSGNFAKTVDAATKKNAPDTYFAIFSKDGARTLVYFTPPELMLNQMKAYAKDHVAITYIPVKEENQ